MSTPEFILWALWGAMSPYQYYPVLVFVVWAMWVPRIVRRHHLTMEDIPEREQK